MQKGNYGICLWFYAALAFALTLLGQTQLCFLLLGFVVIAERNDWLTRQVLQAFFLMLVRTAVSTFFSLFNVAYSIPILNTVYGITDSIIDWIVRIVVYAFCIIGILNVAKEKEASIPLLHDLADRAVGIMRKKTPPVTPTTSNWNSASTPNTNNEQK